MVLLLIIGMCALVSAAAALVLDRLWPQAPEVRLALLAGLLPSAVVALGLTAMLVAEARHVARPDEVDRGMVTASLLAAGPLFVLFSLAIGFTAGSLTLGLRRRNHRQ